MCIILEKLSQKYKVAIKIYGKYYSPATGIEYKYGDVEITTTKHHKMDNYFVDVMDETELCHNKELTGFTSVFIDKETAIRFRDYSMSWTTCPHHRVIVKMKIISDLHHGFYSGNDVILGKKILSVEQINL